MKGRVAVTGATVSDWEDLALGSCGGASCLYIGDIGDNGARRKSITVFLNGVLVQDNYELKGETRYRGKPYYKAHGPSPIKLQAHGDKSEPVSFRNIWVRPS